MLQTVCT